MLEIYFETYGCTANQNSTEIMKGIVKQAGLNLTSNEKFADIIVINSCIVKEPTEEKIRRRIQDLLKQNKKIILSGCMSRIYQKKLQKENLFLLDTHQIKNIAELIKSIKEKEIDFEDYIKSRNEIKLNLPKVPEEKNIGITQISEGCQGECTYCITRLAKGKLFSYPQEKILESIKQDVDSGCKEIWITSQDNANYGNDQGKYLFPELLKNILKIKGKFFVRVGMMNPNHVLKILPELIEIYKHPKMFKFLHIPIQSASDKVLKEMKRNYTKKDVKKIISEFTKEIPDITLSTDVIVGFPEETEEDFQETFDFIREIKPEILNLSKFWPRPRTPASRLMQTDPDIRTERAKKISKLHLEICKEKQKSWLNKVEEVLVDKKGFENTWLARNKNYKLFAVQSKNKILGKKIKVKVKMLMPHYLVCEVAE